MKARRKVILIEIIDLSIVGLLTFGFDLNAIQIQVLWTLNYVLNIGLAYAYITFIDAKQDSSKAGGTGKEGE